MLDSLSAEVVACRACQLAGYLAQAHPIQPTLIDAPRMLLIGQAPGPVTDRKGYHFAGPAGRFLEIWFDRAGFPPRYFREHVYLTSLTRCFPGKSPGGNGDRPPSRPEIALCRRFLDRELELIQPKVVLLVGKLAIDAFLEKRPLVETVGHVFDASGQQSVVSGQPGERGTRLFLPLPHASGVSRWLNDPANRARLDQALAELGRLRAELSL